MNQLPESEPDSPFAGLTYDEALRLVIADPSTRCSLRQRILEDAERDPVDSLNDAEVLCAMQKLRLDAVLSAATCFGRP